MPRQGSRPSQYLSPPTGTLPTCINRDFRRSIVRHGRTAFKDIISLVNKAFGLDAYIVRHAFGGNRVSGISSLERRLGTGPDHCLLPDQPVHTKPSSCQMTTQHFWPPRLPRRRVHI